MRTHPGHKLCTPSALFESISESSTLNERKSSTSEQTFSSCEQIYSSSSDQRSSSSAKIAAQLEIHSVDKPYKYTTYRKSFGESTFVCDHLVTHASDKRYMCIFCTQSYPLSWLLDAHLQTHSEQKPSNVLSVVDQLCSSSTTTVRTNPRYDVSYGL